MNRLFHRESTETSRLPTLSDGVIAIVITLLVLDISVPTVPSGRPAAVLSQLIAEEGAALFGYVLSFIVIGQYWMEHRRVFVHIDTHDRRLLWLNLLFLLFVGFVPFATTMFSTSPAGIGVSFLAAVLALTGFSLAMIWVYASRHQLVEEGLTSRVLWLQALRYLFSPVAFLVSIPVALVNPLWGLFVWVGSIPINAGLQSRVIEEFEASLESAGSGGQ